MIVRQQQIESLLSTRNRYLALKIIHSIIVIP